MSNVCIKSVRLTMEYTAIPKGCGYVYVPNNQTYKRVRTVYATRNIWSVSWSAAMDRPNLSECANHVRDAGHACPICRSDITIVLTLYWHASNSTEQNYRTDLCI